jgi:hypothetical protein
MRQNLEVPVRSQRTHRPATRLIPRTRRLIGLLALGAVAALITSVTVPKLAAGSADDSGPAVANSGAVVLAFSFDPRRSTTSGNF